MPLRTLLVDDEPPARRRLRALLRDDADVEVVGEAGSGREAVALVEALRPDLVLLDVQMPEGDGFDVAAALPASARPAIVFVTAYDAHALRAFEVHALDYLLKPVDPARLRAALGRVRELHAARLAPPAAGGAPDDLQARLAALLDELRPRRAHVDRFVVKQGGRVRLVPAADVDFIEAEANYVRLHTRAGTHLVRDSLTSLEQRLDPAHFLRVHRSYIVRVDRIVELEPLFQGEYRILLRSGARLTSGRSYRARVQQALGLGG